ncbi:MAG: YbaN family protein [Fimbriimonadaceae bacterium]
MSRGAYAGLGFGFVGMGLVGVVVPGWPTTIFMILALWAFKKSSPKMESWLLNHRVFGPTLRDWEENHSIRRRTKIVAISALWVFLILSLFLIKSLWVKLIVAAVGAWVTWFIWSRRTKPD